MLSNEILFLASLMISITIISVNSIINNKNKNRLNKERYLKKRNTEIRRELVNIQDRVTQTIRENDSLKASDIMKLRKISPEEKEVILKKFQDMFNEEEILLQNLENNALELYKNNGDYTQYEYNMQLILVAKEYTLFVETFYLV